MKSRIKLNTNCIQNKPHLGLRRVFQGLVIMMTVRGKGIWIQDTRGYQKMNIYEKWYNTN